MVDEPEYDVFEFDDLCSAADYLLTSFSESAPKSVSPHVSVELKPLPDSLKYSFLALNESLPRLELRGQTACLT